MAEGLTEGVVPEGVPAAEVRSPYSPHRISSSGALQPAPHLTRRRRRLPLQENIIKIILLGDSAVGKSKLVERFLMNEYQPRQARRPRSCTTPAFGRAARLCCASAPSRRALRPRAVVHIRADALPARWSRRRRGVQGAPLSSTCSLGQPRPCVLPQRALPCAPHSRCPPIKPIRSPAHCASRRLADRLLGHGRARAL